MDTIEESEYYAIYNRVLEESELLSDVEKIVIRDSTFGFTMAWLDVAEGLIGASSETLSDLKTKLEPQRLIENRFTLSVPVTLLGDREWNEIFQLKNSPAGWERFHLEFPDAKRAVFLSSVAFDAKKEEALVFVGYSTGFLRGEGHVYVLSKIDGDWRVRKNEKYTV